MPLSTLPSSGEILAPLRSAPREGLKRLNPASRRPPAKTISAGLFAPPNASSVRATLAPPIPTDFIP